MSNKIYQDRRVSWFQTIGLAALIALALFGVSQFLLSPCSRVFADAECPVGSTQTFAKDIGLQGSTTHTLTVSPGTPTTDVTVTLPNNASSTLATIDTPQNFTASKTFDNGTALINDVSDNHTYTLGGGELLGNYAINFPVIADTSTLVTQDLAQILTNKNIDADDNTIADLKNANIDASAGIVVTKLETGTANQILVTDSSGTSNEFTSDITPGSVTVDNLVVNSNLINTDSDLDWSLQNNGNTMLTLQDSGSEGNNNIYVSQNKFSGSGRTQLSAFDGQVAASSDQVIFTADELMSASNKYTTGLVQLISKHDTAGNKWSSYLLFISGRSVSGSNSVTTVTSQTVSGGCPLTFSFDATTFDFIASNGSLTLACDVGATFFGMGAWQEGTP